LVNRFEADVTPASRQIQTAFVTRILLPIGLTILVDRTADQPIRDEERPCVGVRLGDQTFEFFDLSTTKITMDIALDIFEDVKGLGVQADRSAALSSSIVAAVHADRYLGGMLQDLEEVGIAAGGSDLTDLRNDVLAYQATFFCPRGNLNTIIGQSGLFT
jgi:hypothetical protein